MLAGDEVVKEAICEWLSLESEESLKQQLQAAVAEDSRMQDICLRKRCMKSFIRNQTSEMDAS